MAKYSITYTNAYKKDLIAIKNNKANIALIEEAIDILASGEKLPPKYKDHQLKGDLKELRECHIKPNLILLYKIIEKELIMVATRIGSHQKIFKGY